MARRGRRGVGFATRQSCRHFFDAAAPLWMWSIPPNCKIDQLPHLSGCTSGADLGTRKIFQVRVALAELRTQRLQTR